MNIQVICLRNSEIFLISQPRPLRSVHAGAAGWDIDQFAARAIPALAPHCFPPEGSSEVFSGQPV